MKKLLLFTLLLLSYVTNQAQSVGSGTTYTVNITSGGNSRRYLVYVPTIYDGSKPVPLMLDIHGFSMTAEQQLNTLDLGPVADTANFIVAVPQGMSNNWSCSNSTASGQGDRDYLWAMIDSIKAHYNINPCKIYCSGFSMGSFMTYILSINVDSPTRAPVIAAIGSCSGGISTNNAPDSYWAKKNPTHPTPVLHIHGTSDGTIGYATNNLLGQVYVDTLMKYWVNFNGCNPTPTQTNCTTSGNVDHFVWSGGNRGARVELYRVNGGSHSVPNTSCVPAAKVIWEFCRQYCLPYLTSQTCTSVPTISVQPVSQTVCTGDNVTIPITASGCVGTALTYQWQLNSGSGFANLTNSAPYSGVTTSTLTITSSTSGLSGYQYRCLVASCCDNATSNTAMLTVNTCSLTATINGSTTVCQGDPSPNIAFTGSNGTAPYTFTYTINGGGNQTIATTGGASTVSVAVSTSVVGSITYSLISVQDANTTTAQSGSAVVVVNSIPTITSVTGASRCDAGNVTLSATASSGTVNWYTGQSGGSSVATGNTYTVSVSGTTTFYVDATDNNCTTATRTAVTATVNTTPNVPTPGSNSPVCEGSTINLTSSTSTGGIIQYDWAGPNTYSVSDTQNPTITPATTLNSGTYSVTATQNGCTSAAGTTSVVVTSTVSPSVSISINSGTNTICSGQSVTLTATPINGGASPSYQWEINGGVVGTGSSYSSSSFVDNDVVSCVLTSNAACVSPTAATSNSITITVTNSLTPSVLISLTSGSIPTCNSQSLTFTASPTNGGSSPSYVWKINGSTMGGTGNSYTSSSWTNNDEIFCILTSNNSCVNPTTANSNSLTVTTSTVTPSVSIAITSGSNPTCSGQSITFTATPINGGSSPSYLWKVNGGTVGSNSNTYNSSSWANNDVVTCILSSSDVCANPTTANSNSVTVTTTATLTPSVSIALTSGSIPSCSGQVLTFTATPTNGGTSPTYQWQVNGSTVASGSIYSSPNLANNSIISCVLTSNNSCANPTTASSNSITVAVTNSVTPTISIAGNSAICQGQSANFSTVINNGGSSPVYQWKLNGNIVGASSTYTNSSLSNGDLIVCELTSNATCATPTTVSSNTIVMVVSAPTSPSVSIAVTGGSNTICSGQSATFTAAASNGNSYQWKVNGSNAGTNSNSYSAPSLTNGQVVSCVLTSTSSCSNPSTALSNSITMVVNTTVTPSVSISISGGTNSICSGQQVTFVASPSNGGSIPSYQWKLNGINVGTNSVSYINSSLSNSAKVSCVLTSNATCANPASVSSNTVSMVVSAVSTPSISIVLTSGNNPATTGQTVLFTASSTPGTYQWKINGNNVGNNNTYSNSSFLNGDVVTCMLTSSAACTSSINATSNAVTVTVTPQAALSVTVTQTPNSSGSPVLTSSSSTNNQWYLNGNPISGATGQTYTPTQNGVYYVVVNNGNTKVSSASQTVSIPVTITQNGNTLTSSSSSGNHWYIDGVLLTDTTQSITITQNGNYSLVVTISGVSSNASLIVTSTDVGQLTAGNSIVVSPNPNSGNFTISFKVTQSKTYKLEIVDMLGREIYLETLSNFSGAYDKQINIDNKGVYIISLTSDDNKVQSKVIVY